MKPGAESFGSVGEDGLIEMLTFDLPASQQLLVGPGDDCAVIEIDNAARVGLLKTDCVIENVHFLPDAEPERIGWKAAARVVSDFAAMGGGQPEHALITLVAPADRATAWARGVYAGIRRCAEKFGFDIAGGETSQASICMISVAMSGSISRAELCLRTEAKIGDGIFVTGKLGGAVSSGKHLDFEPQIEIARELVSKHRIHAMMDLSDGLAKDLPRLAKASGVGFRLERDAVPRASSCSLESALTEGEDYELLFTSPDSNLDFPRIGDIVAADESEELTGGWDHYR
ncbi:MAG: thiamine-monophosphate kinase [Verrucomicrobiales bacterium]|jgi:thiamine-monophosphate kinase